MRKRIVIAGGSLGMAGATILAAHGAFRSGVGLVRLVVEERSILAVQSAVPQAMAAAWPTTDAESRSLIGGWPDAIVLGPGLGTTERARFLFDAVCAEAQCPVILDADALNLLAHSIEKIALLAARVPVVITPHIGEMARLVQMDNATVMERRFDLASEFARESGAVVLLKGVPTVIASQDGRLHVSAAGSAALATGGSGDVLSGIIGTLVAQMHSAFDAASVGAWVHGRAGELAALRSSVRGATLGHVIGALSHVWSEEPMPMMHPVVADLAQAPR